MSVTIEAPVMRRLFGFAFLFAALGLAGLAIAGIADLYSFEYRPLFALIGWRGLAMAGLVIVGAFISGLWGLRAFRRQPFRWSVSPVLLLVASGLAAFLLLDWMFLERPLSLRLAGPDRDEGQIALPDMVRRDFESFSIVRDLPEAGDRRALEVMYARVWQANSNTQPVLRIGSTIDNYADQYGIDPKLLFYIAYVHSFWGEATSGPVPFLRAMTSETIRDVIQIHTPGWFVNSRLRRHLISTDFLERMAGAGFGHKLRYAFHKATFDVSAQPFELNLLSDVVLVLREYPEEFADVTHYAGSDATRAALRDAYAAMGPVALREPYERPYSLITGPDVQADPSVLEPHKRFVRAAYYATVTDFDLATRIAASLVRYQRDHYRASVGDAVWDALPAHQQAAMLGMTRDVLTTSIGRMAYSSYALPEMNCMPVDFVAIRAAEDPEFGTISQTRVWRPRDYELLWGGASTKLGVMSEVWLATTGHQLPGIRAKETVPDSRREVLRRQ
jgi:hypothetical protein